ncbi:MAG: sigma-70 family RNA polymerase sigma factor [Mucilaginibacter sp.]|uniref:RNA polymerase sigma factor n=1 Tax=Mucilaginibacter sp. TaxID=1882438 RepID=UPI0032650364
MPVNFDENDLIKRVSGGDRVAFTELYTRYLDNLYRYVYLICKSKEVSEEIVQNIFVKIWIQREGLESIHSFKSYIYRSAKNALLDHLKKIKVEEKALAIVQYSTDDSYNDADNRIIYKEYYQLTQKAISLLPEKRKQIVELRTQDDLSLDEISAKLCISKSVVKKQLYTGMDFIRKYLSKYAELAKLILITLVLNKI